MIGGIEGLLEESCRDVVVQTHLVDWFIDYRHKDVGLIPDNRSNRLSDTRYINFIGLDRQREIRSLDEKLGAKFFEWMMFFRSNLDRVGNVLLK